MQVNSEWKDYEIIATGDGNKLERWGKYVLLRPDPQVIWPESFPLENYQGLTAKYVRSATGGGHWEYLEPMPENFTVSWRNFTFKLKLMGFKHTGLFPEQAVNWAKMIDLIKNAGRPVKVLNLFAYTGGATVACASAGAEVTHVDSAKAMVERAGENVRLSGLTDAKVRYIIDDCLKFVRREIKRGRKYDAIIMTRRVSAEVPTAKCGKSRTICFRSSGKRKKFCRTIRFFIFSTVTRRGFNPPLWQIC